MTVIGNSFDAGSLSAVTPDVTITGVVTAYAFAGRFGTYLVVAAGTGITLSDAAKMRFLTTPAAAPPPATYPAYTSHPLLTRHA